jgi:hypothetical protein
MLTRIKIDFDCNFQSRNVAFETFFSDDITGEFKGEYFV